MTEEYFEEMRKFSHQEEMRYRLLMRGVRGILEKKKKERHNLKQILSNGNKPVRIGKWN